MSDDERLHEMLERATAPGSDLSSGLDAETASLREAWLALGRTLAAAEAAASPPREPLKLAPPAPRRRRLLPPVAIFALAASLLVVASIAVFRERGPNVADRNSPDKGNQTAPDANPTEEDGGERSLTFWEWDEQLDTEIGNVASGAIWPGDYSSAFSEGYSAIGEDILRIQEDMNDGTF